MTARTRIFGMLRTTLIDARSEKLRTKEQLESALARVKAAMEKEKELVAQIAEIDADLALIGTQLTSVDRERLVSDEPVRVG